MSFTLRNGALACIATTAGLAGLLAPSGAARPVDGTGGPCGGSQTSAPVAAHSQTGRSTSYVSRSFPESEQIIVQFCLDAARATSTRIIRLEPGGITVNLRGGQLALEVSHAGKLRSAAHRLTVAGTSTLIRLLVTGNGTRVSLYAAGLLQASFAARALAPNQVQIGSPARRRTSSVTFTSVAVTAHQVQVIPGPARATTPTRATKPAVPQPGSSGAGTGSAPAGPPKVSTGAGAPGNAGGGTATTGTASSGGAPASGGTSAPGTAGTAGGTGANGGSSATGGMGAIVPALWPGNPFSPTSFWNLPLAPNAPLDPKSQAYVNEMVRQVNTYGPWMNTTSYSVPVYVVPADEPTQRVSLDSWGPDLQAEFDAVPIPPNAEAASGSDEHMVVWQPSTDKMWEFWVMHEESDGWHASWGGEMDDVSSNPGYFQHMGETSDWGATATGLPLLGGLITAADLQRGYIDHALAISLVETAVDDWSWPAQRSDGSESTPGITAIPEGTRFRLDPTLNIASLNLPPIVRMLAQAAQTYGMVVRDQAGAVDFYAQDPKSLPDNPWPAAFGNQYPNQLLAQFPWSHLEALQTQSSSSSSSSS